MTTVGRIVVGVDGSAAADAALEFAVKEARMRSWTLELVHAEFARREFLDLYPDLERAEEGVLEAATARARQLAPDLEVEAALYDPPAAAALLRASEGADLLVVGSRGLTGVRGALLGSVSSECAHRARCPVVIVRAPHPDGESSSRRAAAEV